MTARPTVGRVVHYHSFGTPGGEYLPEARAAIITAVALAELEGATDQVSLCVLNPSGMFFNVDVPYSPAPLPGHWSWPPRA